MDFVENLRERLQKEAGGAEAMVNELEQNARNPNLGKQQGLREATVIGQYEATAQQLLTTAPNNAVALAALDHVAKLRQRVRDALGA
ncbi:MAG TPA: hypothetical protein VMT95_03230 [Candidatus Binatia bacterium]|nr:hypothetical protein [Candidatus Binatia bacterium]